MAVAKKQARQRTAEAESAKMVVDLSINSVQLLRDCLMSDMKEFLVDNLPRLARIAAADVIHTTEKADTIFQRALKEGDHVRDLMRGTPVGGTT